MRRTLAMLALTLGLTAGAAPAEPVVDQETRCNDGGSAQIRHYEPIGQRFVPRGPNLTGVEVLLARFNPPYADVLTVRVVEGSIGGAFVAAASRPVSAGPAPGWQRFDFAKPVLVVPGERYVLQLDATNSALGWLHQYELPPRCTYPAGEELVAGVPVDGIDAAFRTYTLCGNGTLDAGEQCDDGNDDAADGCADACRRCGDGVVTAPEECDDGDLTDGDGCDASCMRTRCGNGVVTAGETCDDGNTTSGDCCSSTCTADAPGSACGDDGNVCTDDVCDAAGACVHEHNDRPCSDGNVCNGADVCAGGACSVHAGNPCGGRPMCRRSCLQQGASQFVCRANPAGTPCTPDGRACTLDACDGAGTCAHPVAPDGTACDDGDRCTTGDRCDAGVCRTGAPVPCDPCLVCDGASGGCVPPDDACAPAAAGRSSIVIRDAQNPRFDKIVWRWHGIVGLAKDELGVPGRGTGFTLCVFDRSGLRLSAVTPGGGTCAGRACWKELPAGYRYVDPDASPQGMVKLQARAGTPDVARLVAKGRGAHLPMTPLDLQHPVTVRLRRSDGGRCWQAVYSTPIASDALQFKATSD